MKIEEEQKQKLLTILADKWKEPRICQICNKQVWSIADLIVELRGFNPRAIVIGGPTIPSIVATCINCGNTIFFNAIVLGIIPLEKTGEK